MNNIWLVREDKGKTPFYKDEVLKLLSKDFEIVEIKLNKSNQVESLVVKSLKHPELIDPICKGIGLYLQEDGGYLIDPRFLADSEIFTREVLPSLMIDLEMEDDEDMM